VRQSGTGQWPGPGIRVAIARDRLLLVANDVGNVIWRVSAARP
jgi:glucose/arabinose dehydrogenase